MTWEWSHTAEAHAAVASNIEQKEKSWLVVVMAEWLATEPRNNGEPAFHEAAYEKALLEAGKLSSDVLAAEIYRRAEEQALCTNGGHEAWCCPFGCPVHMVPFSEKGNEQRDTAEEL